MKKNQNFLDDLFSIIDKRAKASSSKSYTKKLLKAIHIPDPKNRNKRKNERLSK